MVQSPNLHNPLIPYIVALALVHPSDVLGLLLRNGFAVQLHQLLDTCFLASPDVNQFHALNRVPNVCSIKKIYFHIVSFILGVGRGVRPVGALPPYLPTLLLTIHYSFHTPNINLHALRSTLLPFLLCRIVRQLRVSCRVRKCSLSLLCSPSCTCLHL
jgi:hypothetical protein